MLMWLHPLKGMAVRRVDLRESWVCGRAGLRPAGADTVETVTLQGTYREKILSLGDAFKNFKSLRSLDLSRNIIVRLQGIEYLHALRFLNLYYNDIISLGEIERLSNLSQLKSLDLRLNPVTRQEAKYRLFVIQTLGTLEELDERPVRDSERKSAKYSFRLNEYKVQEMPEGEMGSAAQSHVFGEKPSAKVHLDFNLSNTTELHKVNDWERKSPSKYQSEEHRSYVQPQIDFEDGIEYRPLPSPTRSSMRSPGPTTRAKDGQRVTFADSTVSEDPAKHLESDNITFIRKPIPINPDKPGTAFSFKNTYLTSTPVRREAASNERTRVDTGALDDIGPSTEFRERLRPSNNGEESSRERLLRLSSDLYITTHLNDPPISSNSLSALRKGFSDVSKTYTLPSKPTLATAHLSTAKPLSHPEFKRDYKSAWSPDTTSGLNIDSVSVPQSGMKRASSLNSLLSPKPSSVYTERHNDDLPSENELRKRDSSLRSEGPSITDVLQQLMDLVDRYWNGSGSLLQNQRFLVPARDLLSRLMTSSPAKQTSRAGQTRDPRTSHGQEEDGDTIESFKLKLVKVMEENHFLRSKVCKLENQATRKDGSGNLPLAPDDLWRKYEQLSLQVESVQQQLNKTSKLQETVHLLHNSQRSLVCTNEYLLQQLNKISPTTTSRPLREPSPHRISTDKYLYPDPTELSTPPSSHSTGQYRNPERLSLCPL